MKVFQALLSQAGTAAPTAAVLVNTLGSVSLARSGVGVYQINCTGAFTNFKTGIVGSQTFWQFQTAVVLARISDDTIAVECYDLADPASPALSDDILSQAFVQFIVAP